MIFNEFFYPNKQVLNDFLYIRQAGILNRDKSYRIDRTSSNTIVVGYIESGRLHFKYCDKEIIIGSGFSFVISNGIPYSIFSDEIDTPVMRWLNIRGTFAENALKALDLSPYSLAKVNISDDFETITEWIAKDENCFYEVSGKVMSIFCRIGKSKNAEEVAEHESIGEAEKFDAYLSNAIQSSFSVKKMAEYFNISTDTLNRKCRNLFGKTPYQCYEKIRVDIAKSLLAQSDIPIKDIAERLNYTDRNHFTVSFKRIVGESPASFRINHRGDTM